MPCERIHGVLTSPVRRRTTDVCARAVPGSMRGAEPVPVDVDITTAPASAGRRQAAAGCRARPAPEPRRWTGPPGNAVVDNPDQARSASGPAGLAHRRGPALHT